MLDARCPGCRRDIAPETPEQDGSILTCSYCGYLGVWEAAAGGWRPPTPAEHAHLIQEDAFLEALQFGIALRVWRERDRSALCALIHSQLDRRGVAADVIEALTDEIMAAEYHTHPTDADISAMGLEKYDGML